MAEKFVLPSNSLALVTQYPSESIIVAKAIAFLSLRIVNVESLALLPASPKALTVC